MSSKSSGRGQSPWPCLCPFRPQTVAEASVGRLSGSQHRMGTLGRVRFWGGFWV